MRSTTAAGPISIPREIAKFPAFFRRDLLEAWSYRLSFFADWIGLIAQMVIFALVGRLVDPRLLPAVDGVRVSYIEFAITGIAVATFLQLAFARVINAIREEQLMGTLESLLMTPTSPFTVLMGSVAYDLVYVPIRTILFLGLASVAFGADLRFGGLLTLVLILLAFIPFAWGLGMVGAGAVITYRRGVSILSFGVSALMIGSSAYFPLSVLPTWARPLAELNPVSIALQGARSALLGGGGAGAGVATAVLLLPIGVVSLVVGFAAVRLALARERRRGTLGLY